MKEIKQVIFKLGDEEYGLDIMNVNAIEKYTSIIRVPNTSRFIKGIINLRGDVIPVYNLREKFGLPDKTIDEATLDDSMKLIITKSKGMLIAFEVDSVSEILEINEERILEAPNIVKNIENAYIDKVANINGRMVLLLDLEGILTITEKENIEKIINA